MLGRSTVCGLLVSFQVVLGGVVLVAYKFAWAECPSTVREAQRIPCVNLSEHGLQLRIFGQLRGKLTDIRCHLAGGRDGFSHVDFHGQLRIS